MPALRFASLLCVVAVFSACAISGPNEALRDDNGKLPGLTQSPFFIQMSDTQLGFAGTPLALVLAGYVWNDDPSAEEIALFEKAVEHVNRLKPAFVVICGDLIQTPGHEGQSQEFKRIAALFDDAIPLYLVAGNHDVGSKPTPAALAWYREQFGRDWYGFRHEDVYGIVLNSSLMAEPDEAPEDAAAQLAWLKQELATARASGAAHLVVFQHHSLFLADPQEPDAYFNMPSERRQTYLKLFREAGVEAVLAGHYHRNGYGRDGELEMITTGPIGKPLGSDPSGFRILRFGKNGLEHAYFGISDTP